MPSSHSLTQFVELLQRAHRSQMAYAPGHPQQVRNLEALAEWVRTMLAEGNGFRILVAGEGFISQGLPVEETSTEGQSLVKELAARAMGGLEFRPGAGMDELDLLLFALQLQPQRLADMGGASNLLPDDGHLTILPLETVILLLAADTDPLVVPSEEEEPDWELDLEPDPAPEPPPLPPALPSGPDPLEGELRTLFQAALATAAPVQRAGVRSPWGSDHRDVLQRFGFAIPDFSTLAGAGARLALDPVPSSAMRDCLRKALADLEPVAQGNVLLGLPGFPKEEYALSRALDFLGPELLAQAVAHAHLQYHPSMVDLAILTVALMQCVHDRDLSLEAIRGRLQFEGWGVQEVEELKEAVQWECQGTDTKVSLSLERHMIHEQDPHLVMTLGRQLIRSHRMDDLRSLVAQLEEELTSLSAGRRGHGTNILADLAVGLKQYGLAKDLERRILAATHDRLCADEDPTVCQWSAQAVEAMLGRFFFSGEFPEIQAEMLALSGFVQGSGPAEPWKTQLVRDLMTRVASPANLDLLLSALAQGVGGAPIPQLYAILVLMGSPAAACLVARLQSEQDPAGRERLLDAIQGMGRAAVPVLKDCLASPHTFMVAHALMLLAKAGEKAVLPHVLQAIAHPDEWVRRAAVNAVADLAGRASAAKAVADALGAADEHLQLQYLAILGELGEPVAAPAVVQLLQSEPSQSKSGLRVRLRAVETLGLIPCVEAVQPLQDLFLKRGLFKGRESLGIRLAAARALAAFNTREARESMALALELESQEEVRAVLRQYLVRN